MMHIVFELALIDVSTIPLQSTEAFFFAFMVELTKVLVWLAFIPKVSCDLCVLADWKFKLVQVLRQWERAQLCPSTKCGVADFVWNFNENFLKFSYFGWKLDIFVRENLIKFLWWFGLLWGLFDIIRRNFCWCIHFIFDIKLVELIMLHRFDFVFHDTSLKWLSSLHFKLNFGFILID